MKMVRWLALGFLVIAAFALLTPSHVSAKPPSGTGNEYWSDLFHTGGPNDSVYALAVYDGEVIAGGAFETAGKAVANRIARWSNGEWATVGAPPFEPVCYSVTGQLSCKMSVRALYSDESDLYAGGFFKGAIARWDGTTWEFVGGGLQGPQGGYCYDCSCLLNVSGIEKMDKDLLVSGCFYEPGTATITHNLRWDGTAWQTVDEESVGREHDSIAKLSDAARQTMSRDFEDQINAMVYLGDDLYVGGDFESVDGAYAAHVAKYDGANWTPVLTPNPQGIIGDVFTINALGTDVYVGGRFRWVGSQRANGLARWDALKQTWTPLGNTTCQEVDCIVSISTIQFDENQVMYVGGNFSEIGGVPAKGLATFDGNQWSSLPKWKKCCAAVIAAWNGAVYIAHAQNGKIFRWNGQTLTRIGKVRPTGNVSQIYGMLTRGNNLYVIGSFDHVNELPAKNAARWDGTRWHSMDGETVGDVFAMGEYNNKPIVTGDDGIYFWKAKGWTKLPPGGGGELAVTSSADLIYTGEEIRGGSDCHCGIREWDGTHWNTLGSGIEENPLAYLIDYYSVHTLATVGRTVFAGGNFRIAGDHAAQNFAAWTSPAPLRPTQRAPRNKKEIDSTQRYLRWNAAPDADLYEVELDSGSRNGTVLLDITTTETRIQTPPLTHGMKYFWRIRACSEVEGGVNYCSGWTSYRTFTVKP